MMELDLKDWKDIERGMEAEIRQGLVNIKLNRVVLTEAKVMIKRLNGLTSEEEKRADEMGQVAKGSN